MPSLGCVNSECHTIDCRKMKFHINEWTAGNLFQKLQLKCKLGKSCGLHVCFGALLFIFG